MRKIPGLILILFICTACSNKPPRYAIPEENLVPMLVDFHLNYAIQQSPDFRAIIRQYDSIDAFSYIFEKHGYTRTEFDTTITWYLENTQHFMDIYDEVIMNLTRINDSISPSEDPS